MILIFNLTSYIFQLLSYQFFISLSFKITKIDNNFKPAILAEILLCIINIIIYDTISSLFLIKDVIFTIVLFIILYKIKKIDITKSLIIAISFSILQFCFICLYTYILLWGFNINLYQFNINSILCDLAIILSSSTIVAITKLSELIIFKRLDLQSFFTNLNFKHLGALLSISLISTIPYFVISVVSKVSYMNDYFIAICINLVLINTLVFIYINSYIKKDSLEKENTELSVDLESLSSVVDGTRALKHDFNNIFQAIHGYLENKEYETLELYVSKLMKDCQTINTLSLINKNTFNDQGVYSLVGSKILIATSLNIKFDIDCMIDFSKISFDKVNLVRILGILLDNAIEASSKANEKIILFDCRHDLKKNATIIKISNSYDNSLEINTTNIFKKGFSTKRVKSGIGLWETKQIINKTNNSQIFTNIEKNKFVQTLVIEDTYENISTIDESYIYNQESSILLN